MGPLAGLRVVEIASIGPGPFCAMMLADMGASVLRLERPDATNLSSRDPLLRSRRSVVVDLKQAAGAELVRELAKSADALIEGFRPGVAEKLGIGPDDCMAVNRRLIYGRMTGWGQSGPLSLSAGHDINYIAVSGVLSALGRADQPPTPPMNLVGDFGGGGMLLAFGVLAALLEAGRSGEGQVVDAAMVEGSALLASMQFGMLAEGTWSDVRGSNLLDTGAPFYDVYLTSDDQWVAVGALEPKFFAALMAELDLDFDVVDQYDKERWPALRHELTVAFASRTGQEWSELLEGTDACAVSVLSMKDAPDHPHNAHRRSFVDVAGVVQPAPAPRFSRTPAGEPSSAIHDADALAEWGIDTDRLAALKQSGVVG
ncbi:MAG: CoA transferase [Acidimicrobiia bacterium]|nr:CoA transferase [Acidimicrobiia bacterium]